MVIGYFDPKPIGAGVLFQSLARGFEQIGHPLVLFNPNQVYDYVIVFNNAAHRADYDFNGIDKITQRVAFVDGSEYGWWTHHNYYRKLFSNSFAPGSMKVKPFEQRKLQLFLKGKSFPFFLREFYKGNKYPKSYHPIDFPLITVGTNVPGMASFEDYVNRPYDVYIGWGESHPSRKCLAELVDKLPCKTLINSGNKIERSLYFENIKNAKISISYDGYGSTTFREKEILCRTLLLRNKMAVHLSQPLTDGFNFVEFRVKERLINWQMSAHTCNPEYAQDVMDKTIEYADSDIGDIIMSLLKDIDKMYEIYRQGYHHCTENYTEKATAQYVFDTIQDHDWKEPTPIII